ncbi:unnamed protein product [Prunus armeniaca]
MTSEADLQRHKEVHMHLLLPERALEVVQFAPQLCHGSAHNLLEEMPLRNCLLFAMVLQRWAVARSTTAWPKRLVLDKGNEQK